MTADRDAPALDAGLLVLRVGLGLMMMGHGWPKLLGGPEKWGKLGGAMKSVGIDFAPEFWGFCAATGEFFGGALLALGLLTRPAAGILAFTMFIAWWNHVSKGDSFVSWSHSAEDGIAFVALIAMGPGRWSIDRWWARRRGTDRGSSEGTGER